ncbi:DUF427 domain-containing protein [Alkalibacterium kapii]|uniref:DUF427 domain-containing protein n=1 Tax=Alkalibacterium kapii TaxID=426704 RepID=A0A511ASP1_9LACT|nr:DUF427 domain-containing protein [Alkalibacterium kapii]GEK91214.1 hypothetical protein AKA01nite_08360 [Alkalibacterium kapii]
MKAILNDTVLAESSNTEVVEDNHYFPREDVKTDYLKESDKEYTCPWKGEATYYHIDTGEERKENGAWSYEDPKDAAKNITGYICFDKSLVTD